MLPVLMYHSVSTVAAGPMRPYAVPPALLADQLVALREAGYTLLGLTEALARHDADPVGERVVAVTFDDGYRDFLSGGLAALRAAGARATLYLPAGHLGGPASWLRRHDVGPLMSWAEVPEAVADGLVEIGNHNMVHIPMDLLTERSLVAGIRDARLRLQDASNQPVSSFAYPYGYHDLTVRRAVAAAGHTNACECGDRRYAGGGRRFAVPRLRVGSDHSPSAVVDLVSGGGPRLMPAVWQVSQPAWRMVRRAADLVGVRLA
jgi:peptidoglycan/xylan/chitin deacetylase (PgdA/CDA1 family)